MKILLTGAFGNLGQSTLAQLLPRGHQVRCLELDNPRNRRIARQYRDQIELVWGDITNPVDVAAAVYEQAIIVHLAAIIPPNSEKAPELTYAVNAVGTQNLVQAAQAQPNPPRFLLASTYDLYGHTQEQTPPRTASDPIAVTSHYTRGKKAAEACVQASGLTWAILRFGSIIQIALGQFPDMAFELPVTQRLHIIHTADAGLAVANAAAHNGIWGKILLIAGSDTCRVQYGAFINGMMDAFGLGPLPAEAFTKRPYTTDWVDTAESQQLLQYQRFGFTDIQSQTAALLGWRRVFMPLVRPFVRRWFLAKSPYWQSRGQ